MLEFTRFVGNLKIRLELPEDQAIEAFGAAYEETAGEHVIPLERGAVLRVPPTWEG